MTKDTSIQTSQLLIKSALKWYVLTGQQKITALQALQKVCIAYDAERI